jgi:hypothetical protein
LIQPIEKTHPVNADVSLEVSDPATSYFDCLLEAASQDESISQLAKAPADHVAVAEPDGDLHRLTQIHKCRIPLFETRLRHPERS